MKPPILSTKFELQTSLMLGVLIEQVLEENTPSAQKLKEMSSYSTLWFQGHCNRFVRWKYTNDCYWREWLESKNRRIDPRNQVKVWVRHWLEAYVQDPGKYENRYGATNTRLFGNEWSSISGLKKVKA